MTAYAAIIPILIVALSAIAAMLAEAIRRPGERMPIAGFGLIGAFKWDYRMAAIAGTGVILSAVYMLWMFQRVNYGELTNEKNRALRDLTPREWALMVPTIAMAVFMGVFPNVFLNPMKPSIDKVIERVQGGTAAPPVTGFAAPRDAARSALQAEKR